MGLEDWLINTGLMDWQIKRRVKAHAKDTMRVMLFTSLQFGDKYSGQDVTYSFLAAEALACRPTWERLGTYEFLHTPSGTPLTIDPDHSLAKVTEEVVLTEVAWIVGDLPAHRQSEMIKVGATTKGCVKS